MTPELPPLSPTADTAEKSRSLAAPPATVTSIRSKLFEPVLNVPAASNVSVRAVPTTFVITVILLMAELPFNTQLPTVFEVWPRLKVSVCTAVPVTLKVPVVVKLAPPELSVIAPPPVNVKLVPLKLARVERIDAFDPEKVIVAVLEDQVRFVAVVRVSPSPARVHVIEDEPRLIVLVLEFEELSTEHETVLLPVLNVPVVTVIVPDDVRLSLSR